MPPRTCRTSRPRLARLLAVAGAACLVAAGCGQSPTVGASGDSPPGLVTLTFRLALNTRVYQDSMWGDPPQLAIWMRSPQDQDVRMVAVTYRTAAGDWEGKVACPVALPHWVACYNRQTGTVRPPTWDHPAPDGITCATPRAELVRTVRVPAGTRWEYFVEVNASGDFNSDYPRMSEEGLSDTYGNGQPSLVYAGTIDAVPGAASQPELVGHTDQYKPIHQITDDLGKITTARELLRSVQVSCAK
jgi:hypothetical protein